MVQECYHKGKDSRWNPITHSIFPQLENPALIYPYHHVFAVLTNKNRGEKTRNINLTMSAEKNSKKEQYITKENTKGESGAEICTINMELGGTQSRSHLALCLQC